MPKTKRKDGSRELQDQTASFEVGNAVWGRFSQKWWPALVINTITAPEKPTKHKLFWFGDHYTSDVGGIFLDDL